MRHLADALYIYIAHTHICVYMYICHEFFVHSTGSTDVVSCSVHGLRDPTTAAMHIVLGNLPPYICYNLQIILLMIIQFIVTSN